MSDVPFFLACKRFRQTSPALKVCSRIKTAIVFFGRLILVLGICSPAAAESGSSHDYIPDPLSVQRFGNGYRYTQKGWTVVHIEGSPYERGVQHGRLLAPEIAGYVRCLSSFNGFKSPTDSWNYTRQLTGVLMLRGYPEELLAEMQGIADGASEAGARVDGRRLDVTDIAAINAANELDLLRDGMKATPTGTEGIRAPEGSLLRNAAKPPKRAHPTRCSAFAATGAATADGKIVVGHITMYDLYPAGFYNVWLEVKPENGYRFVMQTTPGGIHSGMDFVVNEAGIVLSETTIQQTSVTASGYPLAARIRRASQYGDSIEKASEILSENGNGLCSTEWILADINRNEIALLTLGTKEHILHRSSRNEWIGGTEGFYWSCNNAKDMAVRLETIPGIKGRPSPVAVFEPSKRDALWVQMYHRHKGRINESFAQEVLTTPALVSAFSVDAVYTTTDLARRFDIIASFGPPVGGVRNPSLAERMRFPEIRPLVSHPWTKIRADWRPDSGGKNPVQAVDLEDPRNPSHKELPASQPKEPDLETQAAWHGTLLPAAESDMWLPIAFAHFEKIVALENALKKKAGSKTFDPEHEEEIGLELNYYRSLYTLGSLAGTDKALDNFQESVADENWYKIIQGKGVLLLHSLRGLLGKEVFDHLMDQFGTRYAGQRVSTEEFMTFIEKETGRHVRNFCKGWLKETGLTQVRLLGATLRRSTQGWTTAVKLERDKAGGAPLLPVTLETEDGEEATRLLVLEKNYETLEIQTQGRPIRVVLDKYGTASCAATHNPFTILTFDTELERTLIVYGTADEKTANQEAARLLQQSLRRREHNISVPIFSDADITEENLRTHHIVLIGRPGCNAVTDRWSKSFPVRFGTASFEIRNEHFAHPDSAVVCAATNPLNRRFSTVCLAGLSCEGTMRVVPSFEEENFIYAQVVVFPHGREAQGFTLPAPEGIRELR